MIRFLKRRLYRDRRRLSLTGVGLIAILVGYLQSANPDDPLLLSIVASVLTTLIVLSGLLLVTLIVPSLRFLIEILTIAPVAFFALVWVMGDLYADLPDGTKTLFSIAIFFGIQLLYTGKQFDGLMMRDEVTTTSRARSPLPPEDVWDGLFAPPERAEDHVDADKILRFERVSRAPDIVRVVEQVDEVTRSEELQESLVRDRPYDIRFRYWVPDVDPDTPFSSGEVRATLTRTRRGGTKIVQEQRINRYSDRAILMTWMDDHFGRVLDQKLAILEKRTKTARRHAGDGQQMAKAPIT